MKKLFIYFLIAISSPSALKANWFGSYGSYNEALDACRKWAESGGKYTRRVDNLMRSIHGSGEYFQTIENDMRSCVDDGRTNVILGYESTGVKKGKHYTYLEQKELKIGQKVLKRFKF